MGGLYGWHTGVPLAAFLFVLLFVLLSSILLCLDLSFVLCGRHIERPAGARPLYELPRFFGVWLGLGVGVGVRRCWFGRGNGLVGGAGAVRLEYQTWVVDGLLDADWIYGNAGAGLLKSVLCRYSLLLAQAQNVCNSFLQFHYGYKSRFGILYLQRQRICQSIPK